VKATAAVQAAHRAAGLPGASPPAWSGYWTFVTATIVVMFILFVARKGTLGKWISFLSWTSPQSLTAASGSNASGTGPSGVTSSGLPGVPSVNTQSATTGTPSLGDIFSGNLPALVGGPAWFQGLFGAKK